MDLEKLLYLQGVGDAYRDMNGEAQQTPLAQRLALLGALHPPLATPNEQRVSSRIEELDALPWHQTIPPFQLVQLSDPQLLLQGERLPRELILHRSDAADLVLTGDSAVECGEYWHKGRRLRRFQLPLPASWLGEAPGYLEASVTVDGQAHPVTLALTPNQAYRTTGHHWGVLLQLYRLRSESQWGIGDFGDLTRLLPLLASKGAGFIQLNPLAAPDYELEGNVSPYAPGDRHSLNPLYLELDAIPEANALAHELQRPCWQGPRQRLAQSPWLDYQEIARLKFSLYDMLHRRFMALVQDSDSPRARAFREFREQWESRLAPYCRSEHHWLWRKLNLEVHPELPLYLQFEARRQLLRLQQQSLSLGMAIGLVGDLPVGVPHGSPETRAWPDLFVRDAAIGAPPDPFAPQGQDWGLAPTNPITQKQSQYRHWRSLLAAQMSGFGGLRLDHIMGLHRLWWCLADGQGYVYYPDNALFSLLAIESHLHRCEPTGEDLGLVPDPIRTLMGQHGIQGNQLLLFARQGETFTPPQAHRQACLFMSSNHDVPSLAQWWSADDLRLRDALNLDEDTDLHRQLDARQQEKKALLDWIDQHGPEPLAKAHTVDAPWTPALARLCLLTCARTHSRRFAIQLDDLLLEAEPVNIPGTWKEYPNWQRRHGPRLESLLNDPALASLLDDLHRIHTKERAES
ncbi:4-alpha-glucanotransferase [Ferrimonas sp. YFM]|uniref:4-alpha-glucanotransferase n=1 Tax=Ferrimonas sp. YFM TaxID=3028878 RepID=UPI0025726686|nr:4-alpha-glucanotransferase [Ferrimonas sp. YFM]BDY05893.1 4-alpha-glucanotransferase [Ferrimonas sp. YFM]